MKPSIYLFVVICSFLVFAGCVGTKNVSVSEPVIVPENVQISDEDLPADLQLALAGVINRMRGLADIDHVRFDPAGKQFVAEESFRYEGFVTKGINVYEYTMVPAGEGTARVLFQAALLFTDVLNRRAGARVTAEYLMDASGVTFLQSVVLPISVGNPRVQAFLVPEAVAKQLQDGVENMADLYFVALDKSLPMNFASEAEKDAAGYSKATYYFMVFCMDRLPPDDKFQVAYSTSRNGRNDPAVAPYYLEKEGWRAAILGGKFKPGAANPKMYIKAYYNSDPEGNGADVMVALFENQGRVVDPQQAGAAQ